jgi:hypothetical protein
LAEARRFGPVLEQSQEGGLKASCVEFPWCEGVWLETSADEECDPCISESLPESAYENAPKREYEVDGGYIRLSWASWLKTPGLIVEFIAYTETGLEYFASSVTLDWLAEQVAAVQS